MQQPQLQLCGQLSAVVAAQRAAAGRTGQCAERGRTFALDFEDESVVGATPAASHTSRPLAAAMGAGCWLCTSEGGGVLAA